MFAEEYFSCLPNQNSLKAQNQKKYIARYKQAHMHMLKTQ